MHPKPVIFIAIAVLGMICSVHLSMARPYHISDSSEIENHDDKRHVSSSVHWADKRRVFSHDHWDDKRRVFTNWGDEEKRSAAEIYDALVKGEIEASPLGRSKRGVGDSEEKLEKTRLKISRVSGFSFSYSYCFLICFGRLSSGPSSVKEQSLSIIL